MNSSLMSRLRAFVKAFIRIFPGGNDLLLKTEVDKYGIRYRGCYETMEQAQAQIPPGNSYDVLNTKKKKNLDSGTEQIDTWFKNEDYPLVYWLSKFIKEGSVLLELGGSIGHFYYSSKPYLAAESLLSWSIAELPEAVSLGKEIAQNRGESNLRFIESGEMSSLEAADIFLTAGTIQYMPDHLADMLAGLKTLPKVVIIHNLPCHESLSYWTIQFLGDCEVPYRIYHRGQLLEKMQELGFELKDAWFVEREINIPHEFQARVTKYEGFCFERSA